MKILFASTSTNQTTGYGRISFNVITYLANLGHDVHHFAFQNYDVYSIGGRTIPDNVTVIDVHKLSNDTFGTDIWVDTVASVSPDVIIIYNDMPVTCALINKLLESPKPCPILSYLDIVYKFQKKELVDHIAKYSDHIFVFSDFWKKHLVDDFSVSAHRVSVFSHGVDKHKFHKINKKQAKKTIGFKDDDFIVFNMNRNSYRKILDITIKAFVKFWKDTGCAPNVKLLINCRTDVDNGYNFRDIIFASCKTEQVDFKTITTNNIILLSENAGGLVSDDLINTALNASDVGLNTCGGEGFGLCNVEGGFLGVPQIVTNTGGLSDIFKNFPNMTVEPRIHMTLTSGIDFHNGELAICDYADFADKLLKYYTDSHQITRDGYLLEKYITATYDWDTLLDSFSLELDMLLKNRPPVRAFYINNHNDVQNRNSMEQQKLENMCFIRFPGNYDDINSHVSIFKEISRLHTDFTVISNDQIRFPEYFHETLRKIVSELPLQWGALQIIFAKQEPEYIISDGVNGDITCYAISNSSIFTCKEGVRGATLAECFTWFNVEINSRD
ncbi:glycosyl transferase [Acanthocystis turfacea Chlorella virus Canal-1]|nr:glycosyl transferase [Acanthocystis turfacea Chlorella virus Canal-1]